MEDRSWLIEAHTAGGKPAPKPCREQIEGLKSDHLRKPDANGNLIPSYVQEGGTVFSNPKGRAHWMTLALCGAFYNPRKVTCGTTYWVVCYGYSGPQVAVSPFSVAVGNTAAVHAYLTYGDSSGPAFLLLTRSQVLIG
jgi:hypothetical protein